MPTTIAGRRAALAALAVLGAACTAKENALTRDTAAVGYRAPDSTGVIDQHPAAVANAVAATITDENVMAQLDTGYALSLGAEQLARAQAADPRVKASADSSFREYTTDRQAVDHLADSLKVTETLPNQDRIHDLDQQYRALGTKSGKALDQAYLAFMVNVREYMLDAVDAAQKGKIRNPPISRFLTELRRSIDADLTKSKQLQSQVK